MFGIKLIDIISLGFWFSLNPGPITYKFQLVLTWLFGGFLILAVVFRILIFSQRKNGLIIKFWRKLFRLCLIMSLIGFILLFFFYEGVPILGARFWFLVWILGVIVWLILALIFLIFKIPKIRKENEGKKQFEKYLPKGR